MLFFTTIGSEGDHDVWRKFLAGDVSAFRQVERWIRGVVHCRYNFSTDQADDLTLETITQVFVSASSSDFQIRVSFRAFVRRIAACRCIELIRFINRNPVKIVDPEILEAIGPIIWANPKEYENNQIYNLLKFSLTKLTNVCQTVLRLRFFEEMTSLQIAEKLGRTDGGVKSNVHRCLADLRKIFSKLLKDEDLDGPDILRGLD